MAVMKLIGLTGSIGMGKSTTAALLRAEGVPVFDADAAVHRLYDARAPQALAQTFPQAIVEGRVDRRLLARAVLGNEEAFKRLEAIIHPLVAAERMAFLARARASGCAHCVLDIPLLFETRMEKSVDVIVVVSAAAAVQRARVMERRDMTAEKFAAILARQLPDDEKRRRAHAVILTDRGMDFARRAARALLRALAN